MEEQKKSAIDRLEENEKVIKALTLEIEALKQDSATLKSSLISVVKDFEDSVNSNFGQIRETYNNLSRSMQITAQKVENVTTLSVTISESFAALIDVIETQKILDTNLVGQKVLEIKAQRRMDVEKNLVVSGLLKEAEVSDGDSFLVIKQIGADGETQILRDHVSMSSIDNEMKEKFSGKRVGDLVDMDGGVKVEILRVLAPVKAASTSEEAPVQPTTTPEV